MSKKQKIPDGFDNAVRELEPEGIEQIVNDLHEFTLAQSSNAKLTLMSLEKNWQRLKDFESQLEYIGDLFKKLNTPYQNDILESLQLPLIAIDTPRKKKLVEPKKRRPTSERIDLTKSDVIDIPDDEDEGPTKKPTSASSTRTEEAGSSRLSRVSLQKIRGGQKDTEEVNLDSEESFGSGGDFNAQEQEREEAYATDQTGSDESDESVDNDKRLAKYFQDDNSPEYETIMTAVEDNQDKLNARIEKLKLEFATKKEILNIPYLQKTNAFGRAVPHNIHAIVNAILSILKKHNNYAYNNPNIPTEVAPDDQDEPENEYDFRYFLSQVLGENIPKLLYDIAGDAEDPKDVAEGKDTLIYTLALEQLFHEEKARREKQKLDEINAQLAADKKAKQEQREQMAREERARLRREKKEINAKLDEEKKQAIAERKLIEELKQEKDELQQKAQELQLKVEATAEPLAQDLTQMRNERLIALEQKLRVLEGENLAPNEVTADEEQFLKDAQVAFLPAETDVFITWVSQFVDTVHPLIAYYMCKRIFEQLKVNAIAQGDDNLIEKTEYINGLLEELLIRMETLNEIELDQKKIRGQLERHPNGSITLDSTIIIPSFAITTATKSLIVAALSLSRAMGRNSWMNMQSVVNSQIFEATKSVEAPEASKISSAISILQSRSRLSQSFAEADSLISQGSTIDLNQSSGNYILSDSILQFSAQKTPLVTTPFGGNIRTGDKSMGPPAPGTKISAKQLTFDTPSAQGQPSVSQSRLELDTTLKEFNTTNISLADLAASVAKSEQLRQNLSIQTSKIADQDSFALPQLELQKYAEDATEHMRILQRELDLATQQLKLYKISNEQTEKAFKSLSAYSNKLLDQLDQWETGRRKIIPSSQQTAIQTSMVQPDVPTQADVQTSTAQINVTETPPRANQSAGVGQTPPKSSPRTRRDKSTNMSTSIESTQSEIITRSFLDQRRAIARKRLYEREQQVKDRMTNVLLQMQQKRMQGQEEVIATLQGLLDAPNILELENQELQDAVANLNMLLEAPSMTEVKNEYLRDALQYTQQQLAYFIDKALPSAPTDTPSASEKSTPTIVTGPRRNDSSTFGTPPSSFGTPGPSRVATPVGATINTPTTARRPPRVPGPSPLSPIFIRPNTPTPPIGAVRALATAALGNLGAVVAGAAGVAANVGAAMGGIFGGGGQNNNPGNNMNRGARGSVQSVTGPIFGGGGGGGGGGTPSQAGIFDPRRPATRDSRDFGSQSKFARVMSRELESKHSRAALNLDPQGYNVSSSGDFETKMQRLGIEYVDLTSDTDYLRRILEAHFRSDMSTKKNLIESARKDGAWPLVYQPKYGDVTTQKLKNVAFLPTQTQGRVVNSDLGTVIIPGQSNYTLRREGLNYVVHSAGKKQTFGSAKDASYFVSSGGFGRKTYGPVTERVFGYPTKNLSQAIY